MSPAPLRKLLVPAIAAVAVCAVLMSLGFWQIARLEWKQALIARVAARLDAAPVAAPPPAAWPDLDEADLEYRPVGVSGRFRHDLEVHVFTTLAAPRGAFGGMGYLVVTPLATADGWYVYVNRGFVPKERKAPETRAAGQTDGTVAVTGLYRAPSAPTWLSAEDDPAGNVWFSRDPGRFAADGGLPLASVAPYLIDARFDPGIAGGLPQGGETYIDFPNNHLGYAITWFGLAAGLAGVFFVFARKRLRE